MFDHLPELQGNSYICLTIVDSQSNLSIIGRMFSLLFYHSSISDFFEVGFHFDHVSILSV